MIDEQEVRMNAGTIFYSQKRKKYYCNDPGIICDGCKQPIDDFVWIKVCQDGCLRPVIKMYCQACFDEYKKITHEKHNLYHAILVSNEMLPKDSIAVLDHNILLKPADWYTTDIHLIRSEVTVDKTKYAGRESIVNCQIGADVGYLIESKDHVLDTMEDIDNYLSGILDSRIEYREAMRIENKKDMGSQESTEGEP